MPERRKGLFRQIVEGLEAVQRLLGVLQGAIGGMPPIPNMGGQGYYDAQNAYLQQHVHPSVRQLLEARAGLHTALEGLRVYRDTNSNSDGGRDEARVNLAEREPQANALDQQLQALFQPIEGQPGDVIRRLKQQLE